MNNSCKAPHIKALHNSAYTVSRRAKLIRGGLRSDAAVPQNMPEATSTPKESGVIAHHLAVQGCCGDLHILWCHLL